MPYKVVDSWDKVVSQQDAIEFGRNKGANTTSVLPKYTEVSTNKGANTTSVLPKYTEVSTVKGAVNLRNCDKAMSKSEREWVRYLFWSLGILGTITAPVWLPRVLALLGMA